LRGDGVIEVVPDHIVEELIENLTFAGDESSIEKAVAHLTACDVPVDPAHPSRAPPRSDRLI